MQETLETLEKSLIQVVMNSQRLLQEFEKNNRRSLKIILLVGITGAGKSTIFNFLSGAQFDLRITNYEEELVLKTNCKTFSIMKEGMQSITKEPNYYLNEENNHLLIDFPGFHDTEGEKTQLIIQMLFFKIVTQYPIKIVYVLRHPENSLGDRGVGLQEFINSQFKQQNIDSSRFTIILNSYTESLSEDMLKKRFQKQLQKIYQKVNENVSVVRKATNQEELLTQFSSQSRTKLWNELIQSYEIKIYPVILQNSHVISKYLRDKSIIIIIQYCFMINDALNLQIQTLDLDHILNIQNQINKLINILQANSKGNIQEWFNSLLKQFEIVSQQLKCQIYFRENTNDFIQIFNFFYQFQEFIEGYQEFEKQGLLAKSQCDRMQQLIFIKLQQLQEQKNHKQKTKEINQNLGNLSQQRTRLEIEYQNEVKKKDLTESQLSELETRYNKIKSDYDIKEAEYQKQLDELERKFQEQRRIKDEEHKKEIDSLKEQAKKLEEQRRQERLEEEEQRRRIMIQKERDQIYRQENIERLEKKVKRLQRSESSSCQLI